MGMHSPRTGAPSMTSNLATVSVSLYTDAPEPALSRLRISTSIRLILMRTSRKKTLPSSTSARW